MTEAGKFIVDDLSKAEWAMKKIAVIRAKLDEKKAQAAKMKSDVDSWLADETEAGEKEIASFESLLKPFAENYLAGTKKKSFSLPSGKIGFRASPPVFMIGGEAAGADNETLKKWIKDDDYNRTHYIKIKESFDWAGFKKTLRIHKNNNGEVKIIDAGGEIIPGMTVEEKPDRFICEVTA